MLRGEDEVMKASSYTLVCALAVLASAERHDIKPSVSVAAFESPFFLHQLPKMSRCALKSP